MFLALIVYECVILGEPLRSSRSNPRPQVSKSEITPLPSSDETFYTARSSICSDSMLTFTNLEPKIRIHRQANTTENTELGYAQCLYEKIQKACKSIFVFFTWFHSDQSENASDTTINLSEQNDMHCEGYREEIEILKEQISELNKKIKKTEQHERREFKKRINSKQENSKKEEAKEDLISEEESQEEHTSSTILKWFTFIVCCCIVLILIAVHWILKRWIH